MFILHTHSVKAVAAACISDQTRPMRNPRQTFIGHTVKGQATAQPLDSLRQVSKGVAGSRMRHSHSLQGLAGVLVVVIMMPIMMSKL